MELTPGKAPLVTVEWVDITGTASEPGLVRRWTDGRLLAVDFESETKACVVLGQTWDEDGWSDYSTFPASCVLNIDELRQEYNAVTSKE
jgi:hypothetical protein